MVLSIKAYKNNEEKLKTQDNTPQMMVESESNTLELSIDGEVRVYKFPAGSHIHVIADSNQVLTDIQLQKPLEQPTAVFAVKE